LTMLAATRKNYPMIMDRVIECMPHKTSGRIALKTR
jgi:hypothetical protein